MKRVIRASKSNSLTKTEAREIAKKLLQESIGVAYYRLENESYSEEDEQLIIDYINKFGTAACKAFGKEYITY